MSSLISTGQASPQEKEKQRRRMKLPVDSSLPGGINSDQSLLYPVIPLIFTINGALLPPPGMGEEGKTRVPHRRSSLHLEGNSRDRYETVPSLIRFSYPLTSGTQGARDGRLVLSALPFHSQRWKRFGGRRLRREADPV